MQFINLFLKSFILKMVLLQFLRMLERNRSRFLQDLFLGVKSKWKALIRIHRNLSEQPMIKNKGALGSLRVQTRHKPSMILPQDNYQVRYKKNGGINTYLDSKLGGYGSKDSTGSIPKKKELTSKN
jgi:hypothetical protein